jgi:small subunit ribosomal protein S20
MRALLHARLQFKEVKVLPNIKSAKKRVLVAADHHERNMAQRSAMKSSLKKATSSITAGDLETAKANLKIAIKTLDETASKGLIHKNQAARRKSRLTKKLNAIAK